jgi:protein-S-isoprenylcysteine O-methyltransferase Ste14
MFPPIFPIYIPALKALSSYGSLIWFVGVVFLWLTRYTHQLGKRWGRLYYGLSLIVRPAGILLIALGWLALYAPGEEMYGYTLGWLPRKNFIDVLNWLAILLFFGLGIWSVIVLGIRRSFLYRHYDDPLITTGPYSLVRHPQFLSVIGLIFFGIQLFNPGEFFLPFYYGNLGANWALFSLSLWLLSILEERELLAHFGDEFRDYAQKVPRLLPN